MSGGSFDYLCFAEGHELSGRLADIELMGRRLAEMGHTEAARDTQAVWDGLCSAIDGADRLRDVWHAAEWVVSGDWGEERLAKVAIEYSSGTRGDESHLLSSTTNAARLHAAIESANARTGTPVDMDELRAQITDG